MNIILLIKTAVKSLKSHMVRSLLTTLGIIIGVISIICVMSLGEGARDRVNQEIKRLGTNFVLVLSASPKRLVQRGSAATPKLTFKDLEAIKNQSDEIALISPGNIVQLKAFYKGLSWQTVAAGVNEDYFTIREWNSAAGEFFTKYDVISRKRVAVIGKTVAKELFGGENPIGETIKLKNLPFTIIGLLEEKGKTPDGNDQDDSIFIPISTLLHKFAPDKTKFFALIMSAKNKDSMHIAADEVSSILRQTHHITTNIDDDFTIFTQADIFQASESASKILNLLLIFIAGISLLVGGIGIMNIMLVTVTERTREIGVRMAIGAKRSTILLQFIFEAIIMCLMGGLCGVLLGVVFSKLLGIVLGWPISISMKSLWISLSSSMITGLFFGYNPAKKAARMSPVQALSER